MQKLSILPLVLASALLALSLSPATKADDFDKKTIVTFDQDVEIPGQVLPAGTYVFKLMRSGSDRFVVQVWTAHEADLVTTLMTNADSQPNPSGHAYVVLDMTGTDEGYPPAVVGWFFGGGDEGRDFTYSGYSNTRILNDRATPVEPEPQSEPQQSNPMQ
jgi:hypothetical protein